MKQKLKRIVVILLATVIVSLPFASAKYVDDGSVVWSTTLDGMSYDDLEDMMPEPCDCRSNINVAAANYNGLTNAIPTAEAWIWSRLDLLNLEAGKTYFCNIEIFMVHVGQGYGWTMSATSLIVNADKTQITLRGNWQPKGDWSSINSNILSTYAHSTLYITSSTLRATGMLSFALEQDFAILNPCYGYINGWVNAVPM